LHFDTTGGRTASLDEFVAMTIVGLVVRINSEEFNVASILSSVDRQDNSGGGSLQTSADDLVLGNDGNTSRFNVNSERLNVR